MNYKTKRFLYFLAVTFISSLVAMFAAYRHALGESNIDFSNKPSKAAETAEQPPANPAEPEPMAAGFEQGTQIKVGLPDLPGDIELRCEEGLVYPKGTSKCIKLRIVKTIFKTIKLALYDENDSLLMKSTDPVVISTAASSSGCSTEATSANGAKTTGRYRGSLAFTPHADSISVVNTLPLEDYLKGVVPCEMPASFAPEAIKAMAIASRSYTLTHLNAHAAQGFNLCSTTHCHVYGGMSVEDPRVTAQIEATRGLVLCHNNLIADAVYHSTCGGFGEDAGNIWKKFSTEPYLISSSDMSDGSLWNGSSPLNENAVRCGNNGIIEASKDSSTAPYDQDGYPVPEDSSADGGSSSQSGPSFWAYRPGMAKPVENTDVVEESLKYFIDSKPDQSYCSASNKYRWKAPYSYVKLAESLRESLPVLCGAQPSTIGTVIDIKVTKRTPSGRCAELFIKTDKGDFIVKGDDVRKITSGGKQNSFTLKSSLFYIAKTDNGVEFRGGGWGHGAGMCQMGAQGRALAGQSFKDIMYHYYPGCTIKESAAAADTRTEP